MKTVFFVTIISFNICAQHLGFAVDGEMALGEIGDQALSPGIFFLSDYEILPELLVEGRVGITPVQTHYKGWEAGFNILYNIDYWLRITAGINYHENFSVTFKHKTISTTLPTEAVFYGFGFDLFLDGICWLEIQYNRPFKNKVWTEFKKYSYSQVPFSGYGKIEGMFRVGFKFAFEL